MGVVPGGEEGWRATVVRGGCDTGFDKAGWGWASIRWGDVAYTPGVAWGRLGGWLGPVRGVEGPVGLSVAFRVRRRLPRAGPSLVLGGLMDPVAGAWGRERTHCLHAGL
jgi:hypothetical protein